MPDCDAAGGKILMQRVDSWQTKAIKVYCCKTASKKKVMAKRSDNFQKFVKQKKGSAIKEEIRQNKRKEKKERAAAIEAHFERKRTEKLQRQHRVK